MNEVKKIKELARKIFNTIEDGECFLEEDDMVILKRNVEKLGHLINDYTKGDFE